MDLFTSSFVTFTVATLFVGVLGGVYGHGRKRVFLGGFAIGAWGFLIVTYGVYDLDHLGKYMLSSEALDYVGTFLANNSSTDDSTSWPFDPFSSVRLQIDSIGNCVFTLTSGLLCALVALRFAFGAPCRDHADDRPTNASVTPSFPVDEHDEPVKEREFVCTL